jgi:hypothetical protein
VARLGWANQRALKNGPGVPKRLQKLQTVLSKSTNDALVAAALPTSTGERQHNAIRATMSADTLQVLASAGKGESTRTILRFIILCLIAGAAIASRLFSVIRKCPLSAPSHLVKATVS